MALKYALTAAAIVAFAGLASASDPDFSGRWKLVESQSTLRALPLPPEPLLHIEHQGRLVKCLADREKPDVVCQTTTDGKESIHKLGDIERKSIAKWEGDALLVNTICTGKRQNFTEMDRWKLSRDGKTLRIRRQIVSLRGEMESVLVYEKQ